MKDLVQCVMHITVGQNVARTFRGDVKMLKINDERTTNERRMNDDDDGRSTCRIGKVPLG